ncbi:amidase [Sagittula salina]|uniref:Amidase n=1 Tax=Sagittula salina TaxID=2820268 RepID=A0A940MJC7_9RHOB|nr:amidase family protein [Sagittula salina]MBP0482576.1 amidase [Sagittula salina]
MPPAERGFSGPDLCALTAVEAVTLLKRRAVSPRELVEASLTRIATTSPAINAMVTPCADRALNAASKATPDSLLAGLPIGIKDLTPVAGVRTTWGTPAHADHIPAASDPLVTRLEARGAVVMGKTNTPEMGAGGNTFNAVFGATRNPWDTRLNAGGSSGGAAAGLATGEVWLSHGSDLGGSLRTPASYCGIVGLRPSPGLVASGPGVDAFDRMGVEGPMARTVADVALFLDAMAGFEASCPLSHPGGAFLAALDTDPGPIRIAFSPDLDRLPVTAEIAGVHATALARVAAPDLTVEEIAPTFPGRDHAFRTFRALGMWTKSKLTPVRVSDRFKPTLKANIAEGAVLTPDDIATATITRTRLFATMQALFAQHDVLACPVTGLAPLPVAVEYPTEIAGTPTRDYLDWLSFAFLATLTGLPALSLPVGFTPAGLPVGLQLIGPPRGEARLLQVAQRLQQALGLPGTPIDPNRQH